MFPVQETLGPLYDGGVEGWSPILMYISLLTSGSYVHKTYGLEGT